jgi:hypothetical protein
MGGRTSDARVKASRHSRHAPSPCTFAQFRCASTALNPHSIRHLSAQSAAWSGVEIDGRGRDHVHAITCNGIGPAG